MEKFVTENLILLEFLVDSIALNPNVEESIGDVIGERCVSFQFLDNAPMLVGEHDFSSKVNACGSRKNVKNGKSCLFSLTPEQARNALQQFDIDVSVFKKTCAGMLPDKISIGESSISVAGLFKDMMDAVIMNGEKSSAKTIRDRFELISNCTKENVGSIGIYVRMSCFGKLIVTQFTMNLEESSIEFKAKEGNQLLNYNRNLENISPKNQQELHCPMNPPRTAPAAFRPAVCPSFIPQSTCYVPKESPTTCFVPKPTLPPKHLSCNSDSKNYNEIGASMRGNALTIRVPKDSNKIVQNTEPEECCCNLPPARYPPISCTPKGQQNVTALSMPGGPKPFNLTLGTGCQDKNISVNPPCLEDPDKEVFLLRIGKKGEGACKQNALELELCTPKGKENKPPPQMLTQGTQFEETDFPPGYLENYYGKEKWKQIQQENARKDALAGIPPNALNGFAGAKGKGGKNGKGGKDVGVYKNGKLGKIGSDGVWRELKTGEGVWKDGKYGKIGDDGVWREVKGGPGGDGKGKKGKGNKGKGSKGGGGGASVYFEKRKPDDFVCPPPTVQCPPCRAYTPFSCRKYSETSCCTTTDSECCWRM